MTRTVPVVWRLGVLVGVLVGVLSVPVGAQVPSPSPSSGSPSSGSSLLGGLMLVLDASGSMGRAVGGGGSRIEAAREALDGVVGALPEGSRVGLTVYGHRVGNGPALKAAGCEDVEVVSPVGVLDRAGLGAAIGSFEPSGYTPIGRALEVAARGLSSVEGPRTVVLVSDGQDTCAPPDPCVVAEGLASGGVQLRVEVVGFQVGRQAREQLSCIAEVTGGSYRDAPDAGSLAESVRALSLRAFREYRPVGVPVAGGLERGQATGVGAGRYLDSLGGGGQRWYGFEVPPGRDFAFSATLVGDRDREEDPGKFEVEVFAQDEGNSCDDSRVRGGLGTIAVAVAALGGPEAGTYACGRDGEGGRFFARVSLARYGGPGVLPLEVALQLTDPGGGFEAAVEEPVGAPVGGGSFATAPLVAPGTYADNIRMGEVQFWAVRVAQGQRLSVTYRGRPVAGTDDDAFAKAVLYSGARQTGPEGDDTIAAGGDFGLGEGFERSFVTGPVGPDARVEALRRPGVFFVKVRLTRGPSTVLADYEVTLAVTGTPTGTPSPSASASASASPSAGGSPSVVAGGSDGDGDGGGGVWVLWVAAAVVVVVAGVGAGGWWWGRRGRPSSQLR